MKILNKALAFITICLLFSLESSARELGQGADGAGNGDQITAEENEEFANEFLDHAQEVLRFLNENRVNISPESIEAYADFVLALRSGVIQVRLTYQNLDRRSNCSQSPAARFRDTTIFVHKGIWNALDPMSREQETAHIGWVSIDSLDCERELSDLINIFAD